MNQDVRVGDANTLLLLYFSSFFFSFYSNLLPKFLLAFFSLETNAIELKP